MNGQISKSPRFVDTIVINTHPDGPTAPYEGKIEVQGLGTSCEIGNGALAVRGMELLKAQNVLSASGELSRV
jgi:hypothetical protein